MSQIPHIDVKRLQDDLASGARVLLDVRTDKEYQLGHLDGHHIPLDQLTQRVQELNPDQPIAVICRSGGRSGQASQFLLETGFKDVVNVEGGFKAWAAQIEPSFEVG